MDPGQQLVERVVPERFGAEAREGLDPGRNQRIEQTVDNPPVCGLIPVPIGNGDRVEAVVTDQVEDLGVSRGNATGADLPSLSGGIHAAPGRPILLYDTDTGAGLLAERFEADSKAGEAGADNNHVIDHFPICAYYFIG